eukprot:283258_1
MNELKQFDSAVKTLSMTMDDGIMWSSYMEIRSRNIFDHIVIQNLRDPNDIRKYKLIMKILGFECKEIGVGFDKKVEFHSVDVRSEDELKEWHGHNNVNFNTFVELMQNVTIVTD